MPAEAVGEFPVGVAVGVVFAVVLDEQALSETAEAHINTASRRAR